MEQTNKLRKLIFENPNVRIMPMVSCNVHLNGDYSYMCAEIFDCEVDEITIYDEDGVLYRKSETEDLIDIVMTYEDDFTRADAIKYVENDMKWEKLILVWISNNN